jgi:hypothetical protein
MKRHLLIMITVLSLPFQVNAAQTVVGVKPIPPVHFPITGSGVPTSGKIGSSGSQINSNVQHWNSPSSTPSYDSRRGEPGNTSLNYSNGNSNGSSSTSSSSTSNSSNGNSSSSQSSYSTPQTSSPPEQSPAYSSGWSEPPPPPPPPPPPTRKQWIPPLALKSCDGVYTVTLDCKDLNWEQARQRLISEMLERSGWGLFKLVFVPQTGRDRELFDQLKKLEEQSIDFVKRQLQMQVNLAKRQPMKWETEAEREQKFLLIKQTEAAVKNWYGAASYAARSGSNWTQSSSWNSTSTSATSGSSISERKQYTYGRYDYKPAPSLSTSLGTAYQQAQAIGGGKISTFDNSRSNSNNSRH